MNHHFFTHSREIREMPNELQKVIDCFDEISEDIDSENNNSKKNKYESNDVLEKVKKGLEKNSFEVECGKKKNERIEVTIPYGGEKKSFYVDARS